MPTESIQKLPVSIMAGDTRTFQLGFSDVNPADGWSMFYVLTGDSRVVVQGTANGDNFEFTLPSNKTESWKAQPAAYALYAKKDQERKTLARGTIQIYDNPESDSYGERIHQLNQDLINIRNFKSRLATDPKLQMSFQGASFSRANIDELLQLEENIAKELHLMKFGHTNVRKTVYGVFGR